MLFLHHYFNTHSPSTVSSSLFIIIRTPSHLFFLLFILSLHVSIISFYLSVSLAFCCSDTQTLRQMSHEIFAIKTQREFLSVCISVCVGGRLCTWEWVFVCIMTLALSLSGLLATLKGSPPAFDPTSVIQKVIWQAGNQIGC